MAFTKNSETDIYIAPNGNEYVLTKPPVRVVMSQEGTGTPPISYVTQRGPYQHGESLRDFFLLPRTVQMIVRHNYCSRADYWNGRNELLSVLLPNAGPGAALSPGTLRKIMPNGTVRDLLCVIDEGPKFEPRDPSQWDEWAYTETLRFIAHNPVFFDPTQQVFPGPAKPFGGELPIPPGFGFPQVFPSGVVVTLQSLQDLSNALEASENIIASQLASIQTTINGMTGNVAFFVAQTNLLNDLYSTYDGALSAFQSYLASVVALKPVRMTDAQIAQFYSMLQNLSVIVNQEINAATDFLEIIVTEPLYDQVTALLNSYSRDIATLNAALIPPPLPAIRFPVTFPITFYNNAPVTGASPFVFPLTFPMYFTDSETEFTINYVGNWPEYPKITINGPVNGFTITNTTTGQAITSTYAVQAGDYIVVDLSYGNKSVMTSDGRNIIGYVLPSSNLAQFQLVPGANVIRLIDSTGYPIVPLNLVQFSYYNRYFGI